MTGSTAVPARSWTAAMVAPDEDFAGLALFEEANHHGVRAAEASLAGLGRPFQSWLV